MSSFSKGVRDTLILAAAIVAAVLVAGAVSAEGPDREALRAEIMEHAIWPCIRVAVNEEVAMTGGDERAAMERYWSNTREAFEIAIGKALDLVEGADREFRVMVYDLARESCIDGYVELRAAGQ